MNKPSSRSRVLVMTFWSSLSNYGQILQGYALQNYLKKNGFDAKIIRYENLFSKYIELFKALKISVKQFRCNYNRKFNAFKNANISYTKNYHSFSSLKRAELHADKYIVGSDQVWNHMRNIDRRKSYLLEFVQNGKRKIAYAASFGRNSLTKSEIPEFKAALSNMDFVGVREQGGNEICKNLGIKAFIVVDPVALLSKNEWLQLKDKIDLPNNEKQNIFMYTLQSGKNNSLVDYILNNYSDKFNITFTNSSLTFDKRATAYPSIGEWISYISETDLVITDSFHCTLFCLIFNTSFVVLRRPDGSAMSDRFKSLLTPVNLLHRVIGIEDKHLLENYISESIEWKIINTYIQNEVKLSKNILDDVLLNSK